MESGWKREWVEERVRGGGESGWSEWVESEWRESGWRIEWVERE